MIILMRATRCVCEDGWRVRVLERERRYEVSQALGVQLLRLGWAVREDCYPERSEGSLCVAGDVSLRST